jgi:hypothetical protein
VVLIATAIAGAASDLSGDAAEKAVKGLPGVQQKLIDAHSHMGDKAYILAGVLDVLALVALVRWRRRPVPAGATLVAVLATAFVSGAMAYTALLGGRFATPRYAPEPPRWMH